MSKRKRREDQSGRDRRKGIEAFTFVDASIIDNNPSQNASTSSTHRSNPTDRSEVISLPQWNIEGDQVSTINSLASMPKVPTQPIDTQPIDGRNSDADIHIQSVDSYQVFEESDFIISEENNPQARKQTQSVWFSLTLIINSNSTQLLNLGFTNSCLEERDQFISNRALSTWREGPAPHHKLLQNLSPSKEKWTVKQSTWVSVSRLLFHWTFLSIMLH